MLCFFFNVKTVGFNYCLIDSLNVFTLRCIAALVLATLSDSKTMKDEEYLCPVVFKSHGSGASLTEEQNFSDPNLKCVTAHGIPSKNFC